MSIKTSRPVFAGKEYVVRYEGLVAINRYNEDASKVYYEIIDGPGKGASGDADLDVNLLSEGVYAVSWQEASGATIVHVDDFINGTSLTYFTTAENDFYRLKGSLSEQN